MKRLIVLTAFLFIVCFAHSQLVIKLVQKPVQADAQSDIFITGNFENWSGGNAVFKFCKNAQGIDTITIWPSEKNLEFKFTQGNWQSVETDDRGEDIQNRNIKVTDSMQVVELKIQGWKKTFSNVSSASQNVYCVTDSFLIPQLGGCKRRILIYLPPNYKNSKKRFPVMYMHDGQNLFDKTTSYSGEWKVDETLNALYKSKNTQIIVVGIYNGGTERINELTPFINVQYSGGNGDAYIRFIIDNLKPYIDNKYRTKPDRQNTAIMGSSLGGLISYYAALQYPDVFGKAGVFSPSFWFSDSCYNLAVSKGKLSKTQMYMLAGKDEVDDTTLTTEQDDVQKMANLLLGAGFNVKNLYVKLPNYGKHNEAFWSNEFGEAVEWLFPN